MSQNAVSGSLAFLWILALSGFLSPEVEAQIEIAKHQMVAGQYVVKLKESAPNGSALVADSKLMAAQGLTHVKNLGQKLSVVRSSSSALQSLAETPSFVDVSD